MSIKAMQDYVYVSKYARYDDKKKRRETWGEAVDRVEDMHVRKYPQIKDDIKWAFDQVRSKRVLGSQRALQFGGKPIESKNARIFNCIASYCDRPRFFQECFWLLLCGCGAGFSVQKHHIQKLPKYYESKRDKARIYNIPDTIEGWSDALGILLATYIEVPEFSMWKGFRVEFDYSSIRPKGSVLASGVGKAPGHEPLKNALEKIRSLLEHRIYEGHEGLRPIDAYDIVMHASDSVISGGVRRSATLCIFSPDDDDMVTAKTGNWFIDNPQRGRSNNSALLLRDKTTKEQFEKLIKSVKEFGEPGFIWADNTEALFNPCVEIGLYGYDEFGNSGWQPCNLCEINGKKLKTREDFEIAAKAAAIIGTIQAGYTDFTYLGEVSKRIADREALLGISITGMMDNPDIIFDKKNQQEIPELIIKWNKDIASKIGINQAARTTCIKPAGSTSCILGSASGIHPHHARRYLRRVQSNTLEAPLNHFKSINPHAVEKSVWNANGTDDVITFCIEVPDSAKTKLQLSALDLLEYVKTTQENWVGSGKVKKLCVQPWLCHNVSNTVNVRSHEWEEVANYIFKNRKYFAGISLLPASGDLDYPQAPMCTIHTAKEIVSIYGDGSIFASGLIVDGLRAFDNNLWEACDWANGLRNSTAKQEQLDWVRRAVQFAQRYFGGDVRKMTYCLKDTHNWKLWQDLQREYKDVDYSLMHEEKDETKLQETIACAGGSCEIFN